MSDTTGWERVGDEYHKYVLRNRFEIFKNRQGQWELCKRYAGISVSLATRPTLRECQILAHQTARLWAGDDE